VCINLATFNKLVKKIKGHPIFYNNSNCPQLPPTIQLAVFLNHAGHYGNHAGPNDLADWIGTSSETVENCMSCVMVAILQHHDEVFGPLSDVDSELSKQYITLVTCPRWKGRKLTGDGLTFPLFEQPGLHGDAWFDRKSRYSITQVCGLHFRKIDTHSIPTSLLTYLTTSFLLTIQLDILVVFMTHAFQSTQIYKGHEEFLELNEWMWADSAYPSTT